MITEVHDWVARQVAHLQPEGPVLEVGSYDVNGSVRDLFPDPYLGVDLRPGPGVDLVADAGMTELERKFNALVCVETLEHCRYPVDVLANMCRAALPGAVFIGTWPFLFPLHDYPSDYWRATPEGFKVALEEAGFTDIDTELLWGTHSVATARVPADVVTVTQEQEAVTA